ncbi:hypothetical protein TCAL_02455 [Tigriopus californicus]|uniref:Major facilitator superfamily (MFS) profile domain-containing protein n=1 Tax=Tigriopus californicus TaxID=6832 RepID=A0A553NY08_TIGCA|nr:facilitated trehalose transporter Tret1-like [Tigriopus californicus]TRY70298.1 hypothetical protein TCAL_02455 [Tigriopus californicus]|eukprot:TCALIF_02455-PA protein Name:"Similar to Tret1 Facilitated trehalose transporter Tret1 (Culex quinquefasciatus)" AED:0.01 eAED:0.01 QI:0/-1/0/1/-1/1/1/0/489
MSKPKGGFIDQEGGKEPQHLKHTEGSTSTPKTMTNVAMVRQTLASLGFSLGGFAMGTAVGWSATALKDLSSPSSPIPARDGEVALIGALICLGAVMQGPMTGYLMVRFGRRIAMLLNCLPLIGGWAIIILAYNVWMLFVGRFVTGYAMGSFAMIAPVYIGEIASPEIRGALGTCFHALFVFGIFVMFILGAIMSWMSLAIFSLCAGLVLTFVLYLLQDSPTSYMMQNRPDLAQEAMKWFLNSDEIEEEIRAVKTSVEEIKSNSLGSQFRQLNICSSGDPTIRKPLLLSVFLLSSQQWSGINAVITFTVTIFQSAGATVNPNTATIIIGGVQFVATVLSYFTVNRIGRRVTLMVTLTIMAVSLICFGIFFYLHQHHPSASVNLGWLPLLSMAMFIISFSFGPGPLAWLLLGELLSPKIMGMAGPMAAMTNWSVGFIVTLCFPFVVKLLGDYGAYWMFSAFCLVTLVVVMRYLPETRNKTLQEIQISFTKS